MRDGKYYRYCVKCEEVTERNKPRTDKKGRVTTGDCKVCNRRRTKAWLKEHPEKALEHTQKKRANKPLRYIAQNAVNNAVASGVLTPIKFCSCSVCGKQAKEYHHDDYTKPLEVIALCHRCHVDRHEHASVQRPADQSLGEEGISA